jgi:uncharacterized membrane protein affecting hemolysin expression
MTRRRIVVAFGVLLLASAGAYGWLAIRHGFSAQGQLSVLEKLVARRMAVPASYKTLKNPYRATPENIRAGLEHFADHSAVCHAND